MNRSSMNGAGPASRRLVAVVAVLVAFGLGVLIGRGGESDVGHSGAQPPRAASPTSRSQTIVNGVRLGYEPTRRGAVAAATEFARVLTGPSGDPILYDKAMQTVAAPQWKRRAAELASNAIDFVTKRYGARGSVSFEPLRYRVDSVSGDKAAIELWGVVVGAARDGQRLEESWITGTVRLTWVEDDWRVDGQDSEAGPTPRLIAGQDAASSSRLVDLQPVEHASEP